MKQTNADGSTITTSYDMVGQPVSVTDANGNTAVTQYDNVGRGIKLTTHTNGYIVAALGFSMDTLRTGSWLVAGLPTQKDDLMNEFTDWIYIEKGYGYY